MRLFVRWCLPAVVLGLAACGGTPPEPPEPAGPEFAFIVDHADSFSSRAAAGAQEAAARLGATVTIHVPSGGLMDQQRILEDLLARGVDGVAVAPIDPEAQAEILTRLAERTHLITFGTDAPETARACFVGMDDYVAGRMCGELVKDALPEGGAVGLFVDDVDREDVRRRRQGVIDELLDRRFDPSRFDAPRRDAIRGSKYTIVGTFPDGSDRTAGMANVADALSRREGLDVAVGLSAYHTPVSLDALTSADRLDVVRVVGFGDTQETMQGIRNGDVFGTVARDPYAYGSRSIEVLDALVKGNVAAIPPRGVIKIALRKVTGTNVEEVAAASDGN